MNYKLFLKKIILAFLLVSIVPLASPLKASAGEMSSIKALLHEAGNVAKYETTGVENQTINLVSVAGGVIKIFLSVLGIIFIILMIYGGFLWMTARGSEEQVTKATDLISNAIIGLIIVVAAYALTYFVLFMFSKYFAESVSGF